MLNQSEVDKENVHLLQPLVLAYIGDCVFDLYVKTKLIGDGMCKNSDVHKKVVGYSSARGQAEFLEKIEPILTKEEQEIVRRGRNATHIPISKRKNPAEYAKATALETLIGYLYLKDDESRVEELLGKLFK